jgi:hypothetical protein
MVRPPDIAAAVTQAAREARAALPPGAQDRHIAELRVRAPANATPAQLRAAACAALTAALKDTR